MNVPSCLFFFHCVFVGAVFGSIPTGFKLSSPQVTDWGTWENWESCPVRVSPAGVLRVPTYAIGMQLKTQTYMGSGAHQDDTSLNGIRFFCAEIGSGKSSNSTIASGVSAWGSFRNRYYCDGVVTGFQLRSEKQQGSCLRGDDTAANNLRIFCNGNQQNSYLEGDGERWGDWTEPQHCQKKQAICGIQTQTENPGSCDETALNNIRINCCDVTSPAESCSPGDDWELVIQFDNLEGSTPTTVTYEQKLGISFSNTKNEGGYKTSEVYHSIGFDLGATFFGLGFNFGYNYGVSTITGYDWSTSNTEMWSEETTKTVGFDVPAGKNSRLLQVVGTCDFYNTRTTHMKRIDTDRNRNETESYFDVPWFAMASGNVPYVLLTVLAITLPYIF